MLHDTPSVCRGRMPREPYNLRHGKSSFRREEQCCAMYFSSFLKEQGCGPGRYFFRQFEKKIILPRILVQPSMAQPCSFAVAGTHARGSHVRSPREHSSRRRAGGRFILTEGVDKRKTSRRRPRRKKSTFVIKNGGNMG